MFAQSAALLFFETEESTDGKPFEGFLEFAFVRGNHAGECGRQLRAHGDFALTFVGKVEKLVHNFRAAFLFVQFSRLENGAFPFDKAIATSDFAPTRKDVIADRAVVGQKIAKTG